MITLSPHFSLEELTVTDVHDLSNSPSPHVISVLTDTAQLMEVVRDLLDSHPIHVNSGFRSPEVNARVGGAHNSAHMFGHAVDFICPGFGTPLDICRLLAKEENVSGVLTFDQLIEEGTWVHISFDPQMRGEVLTKVPGGGYRKGLPS